MQGRVNVEISTYSGYEIYVSSQPNHNDVYKTRYQNL